MAAKSFAFAIFALILVAGSEAATVYATAKAAGLTTLVAAIDAAGMKGAFNHNLRGTVFAPTNEAFAELIAALNITPEDLLGNKALLRKVLKYHVVFGKPIKSSDIPKGKVTTVYTWDGLPLGAKAWGKDPKNTGVNVFYGKDLENKAKVVAPDVRANTAIVHVINKVLVPVL
ncbi:hypothetical protein Ndes2437B_g02230 [Nannochloris sp. 'desiccata']